jgi:hypothetical protein
MQRVFGLFAAFLLCACLSDGAKSKEMAACQNEADRFYQTYNNADVDNPRARYIIACMVAKGYKFEVSRADCDSHYPLVIQSGCYSSQSWITGPLDWLRSH